jgi:hypothetical protein
VRRQLTVIGALGLLLPPLTGIAAWLAVAAAIGLALVQIGGMTLHLSRGEVREIGLNIVLLALAALAVWLGTVWLLGGAAPRLPLLLGDRPVHHQVIAAIDGDRLITQPGRGGERGRCRRFWSG